MSGSIRNTSACQISSTLVRQQIAKLTRARDCPTEASETGVLIISEDPHNNLLTPEQGCILVEDDITEQELITLKNND